MPESAVFRAHDEVLSHDEIVSIATTFVEEYGVTKIRLTGGEPLVRKDARQVIKSLGNLPVELAITTNGVLLNEFFDLFKEVGLSSINISLDSLDPVKNGEITRRPFFHKVMANISKAIDLGFNIKVNMVVIRGVNEEEIYDFVRWTKNAPVHVRFIEFMPFDGNNWNWEYVVPYKEILEKVEGVFPVEKIDDSAFSTAKSFRVSGYHGTFAVISSITSPFCGGCNRIRLTSDGHLKNCLFSSEETQLNNTCDNAEVKARIEQCIDDKYAERGGKVEFFEADASIAYQGGRCMTSIGG